MDFAALRALSTELNFSVIGVCGLVTRPDQVGVETQVIWLTPITEDVPVSSEFQRRNAKRGIAVRRKVEIDTVPRGSVIRAAEYHCGPERDWKVDGVDRVEADHIRVTVIPIDEED